MPATSKATIARRAAGIPDPPKSPMRQEQGRKGGRATQTKLGRRKSQQHQEASRASVKVRGGRVAMAEALHHAAILRAKLSDYQKDISVVSLRLACDTAPDAVAYLSRLVRGEERGAAHRDRITAAKTILDIAGIQSTSERQRGLDDKSVREMSLADMERLLADMERHAAMATVEGEVVRVEPPVEPQPAV